MQPLLEMLTSRPVSMCTIELAHLDNSVTVPAM